MKSVTGNLSCTTGCCGANGAERFSNRAGSPKIEGRILRDIDLGLEILKKDTIVIKAIGITSEHSAYLIFDNRLISIPGDCVEWLPTQSHSNDDERDHVL